jgi:ABC-type uncharacterized transport system substrate-binding protein
MSVQLKWRQFLTLLGGAAAAWPLAAGAQQPVMPVIGFLDHRSPETVEDRLRGFRQGLKDTGYVEGDNVTIVYRWGEYQFDRLPELAAQLVRRQVAVIVPSGSVAAPLAAKAATTTIPIVFGVPEDPVRLGLVASLARPRELVPGAAHVAVLVNPANAANTETTLKDVQSAARAMRLQIQIFNASTSREVDAAFASFGRERPDALFVGQDGFFNSRRLQLANMAARYAVPMTSGSRDIAEVGGLMSYGGNITDAYRQMGVYAGRILKGATPTDLPVVQASKFELVINHQTARMLGLTVPDKLLVAADEVIE